MAPPHTPPLPTDAWSWWGGEGGGGGMGKGEQNHKRVGVGACNKGHLPDVWPSRV